MTEGSNLIDINEALLIILKKDSLVWENETLYFKVNLEDLTELIHFFKETPELAEVDDKILRNFLVHTIVRDAFDFDIYNMNNIPSKYQDYLEDIRNLQEVNELKRQPITYIIDGDIDPDMVDEIAGFDKEKEVIH